MNISCDASLEIMYPANSFTIKFVMPVSSELAVALQLHSDVSFQIRSIYLCEPGWN